MTEQRLVFPCGAFFPLKDDGWPVDGAHYAKDGAIRFSVHPSSKPCLTDEVLAKVRKRTGVDYDGARAPCEYFCPTPKRRKEQMGYSPSGERGKYITCYARLYEELSEDASVDITPPAPAKCPHCEEQRTYERECRRVAAKDLPDRMRWRKCPQCERYAEVTVDTGLCRACQEGR